LTAFLFLELADRNYHKIGITNKYHKF